MILETAVQTLNENTPAQVYFEQLQSLFETSIGKSDGLIDRFYRIAGFVLHLRFSGSTFFLRFSPAFDHLLIPASDHSDLTISLWDAESTANMIGPLPWSRDDYLPMGFIRGYNDERFVTIFQQESQALNMYDTVTNKAIFCVPDVHKIPSFENGHPLIPLLHSWFSRHERQLVHAGAVGRSDGGVLISGRGGCGKSSTALTCLGSSLSYAGDDFVAVRLSPEPFVYSVYNTGKLEPHHLVNFPHLVSLHQRKENSKEKILFYLHQKFREKLISGFPIKALLFPQVVKGPSQILPITPHETLKALAISTVSLLPGSFALSLKNLTKLARRFPGYLLELGSDLSAVPALIEDVISRVSSWKSKPD